MLFIGDCEFAFQAQGARQRGFTNPAGTDDDDEFIHDFIIKDFSLLPLPFDRYNHDYWSVP